MGEKMEKDWKDSVIQSYYIDVLPSGKVSDMYFHRKKGVISNNIGGIDYLENINESSKRFTEKIQVLAWESWREFLSLRVNKKPILLVPVAEIVELQVNGTLKKGGHPREEEQKIKVPFSFHDNGQPKELIEILRHSASSRSVGFSNALGSVAASTLNFEVEY